MHRPALTLCALLAAAPFLLPRASHAQDRQVVAGPLGPPIAVQPADAAAQATTPPLPSFNCENFIRHEPVLMYQEYGTTLGGVVDRHLTVYSDGQTTLSERLGTGYLRVQSQSLGQAVARQLHLDLAAAGVDSLCDASQVVSDVPLRTVTWFARGGGSTNTNTFSYWINSGGYGPVQQIIQDFEADYLNRE